MPVEKPFSFESIKGQRFCELAICQLLFRCVGESV